MLTLQGSTEHPLRPETPLGGNVYGFRMVGLGACPDNTYRLEDLNARVHVEDRDGLLDSLQAFLDSGGSPLASPICCRIGWGDALRRVNLQPGLLKCPTAPHTLFVVLSDVTEEHALHESLKKRLAFFGELIDTLPNAVFAKTEDVHFVTCNRAYEAFFGIDRNTLIGKTVIDLDYLPMSDRLRYQAEDEQIINNNQTVHREVDFDFADGQNHNCLYWSSGFHKDSAVRGLVGVIVDISEQKRIELELGRLNRELAEGKAEIERVSRTDPLTGLANRRFFMDVLQPALSLACRHDDHGVSLIMIDLDHFKSINDGFGHEMGDRMLVHFADLLRHNCRQEDLPARTGGEEFHILLPMTRLAQARRLAERLCHSLAASPLPELTRPVTISAGVVERRPGDSPETLLKRVDELLYQAKAAGRNRVCSE